MNKSCLGPNRLWRFINFVSITKNCARSIDSFKSGSINFRLALFNPYSNGLRYLKTLIYCLCEAMSTEDWGRMRMIKNRSLGNPITVKYNNEGMCLDYLQAIYELGFLEKHLHMPDIGHILEIGAGYGRTCHAIMSNRNIKEYYIVDLDNCLVLSRNYLKEVLDDAQFSKVHFIRTNDLGLISDSRFDLCINIDSFSEMDAEVVRHYLDYIDRHCEHLYIKNPVCNNIVSPIDKSMSWSSFISSRVYNAVGSGLFAGNTVMPKVIDVFDIDEVKKQVAQYLEAYCPGTGWKCVADAPAMPWSNYWQAIFRK
jgi:putative sugar O-methyltransferase